MLRIYFLFVIFLGVEKVNSDDQEDVCDVLGVPEDRMKWCDLHTCDDIDKEKKDAEEISFVRFTDKLYEMDCVLDQKVPKDVKTVEDRWVLGHPGEDKWGLRIKIYGNANILVRTSLCKNCTINHTPKDYFNCMTDLRELEIRLVDDQLAILKNFLVSLDMMESDECKQLGGAK